MAGGVLGKIQGGLSNTLEKAKELAENFTPQEKEEMSLGSAKKQRNNLMQDKQKYLCYLGMAAYNLYRDGKLNHEELQEDFEKLQEIDNRLDELDKSIEKLESMKRPKNICECGAKLSKNDQFCPNCGKKVKNVIICKCGAELMPNAKFCNCCGAEVSTLEINEPSAPLKTCICGAKVSENQVMCMECGRIVE